MAVSPPQGSRLISRVLPVAIKLWLQTQLDEIGDLAFEIQATDRQVLSGRIPGVSLSAQQAVYQGVRITDVTAQATGIAINIGQVLRGKSLRLKQAFPVEGQVAFDGDSLGTSSTDSVLAEGLLEFWQTLLAKEPVAAEVASHYGVAAPPDLQLDQYQSKLEILGTDLALHLVRRQAGVGAEITTDIKLRGGVEVDQGHILRLTSARWCLPTGEQVSSESLHGFSWNLGEQTDLRSLTIQNDRLTCQCKIMVQP
ncbi:DUF2993 domain-containing protein [Leptolyngbya cf. ectocarpi LEGE 11479]|uniref:DUF2993 domain-containing protein n=1 Tax=Leptolyngbya cf. ectocarpi LEGE 11479 TaxID=1828722 RepID=A0A928ZT53_LEPEC|nr:DUF2993 domain-containing protein [Leptolyngbya ectocarpi]MBE9066416.1 DUF2993 domain-containing protein [Leptolyngbya cf. ectocarpi LEGE 11479]